MGIIAIVATLVVAGAWVVADLAVWTRISGAIRFVGVTPAGGRRRSFRRALLSVRAISTLVLGERRACKADYQKSRAG